MPTGLQNARSFLTGYQFSLITHMTYKLRLAALACILLLNFGAANKIVLSVRAAGMHSDRTLNETESLPNLKIKPPIGPTSNEQVRLIDLIKDKIAKRERFFGIEISARSNADLDYGVFKRNPLFTSVVWIGDIYANFEPITEAPAIKCAEHVSRFGVVMPHITCYNMTDKKLDQFPFDTFKNVLVLRGDNVVQYQNMKHAAELVKAIRDKRKNDISIAVGGYPEVHPQAFSKADDLRYLKEKVEAGADMIITQICYSADVILDFIRDCRKMGINVPILPGIFIPQNYHSLDTMCRITKVCPPNEQMEEYKRLSHDQKAFEEYSRKNAMNLIQKLFESDQEIYGVQFFTLNYFDFVSTIINGIFE